MRRAGFLALAGLGLLLAGAQPAPAVEDRDRRTAEEMVGQQIEAFRRDDAAGAFAFASPGIREMFGSPDTFLEMVKRSYPAVHRPRSFTYGPARDVPSGFELAVAIQDSSGADWDAVYTFEKGPDGSWKISGCRMVKRPGEAV